ncbi:MAG: hypothetical protein DRJ62_00105 [Thermoprotei archaeon]|nr:MAG: hypothetical protein DRJ62_00105 [Thermoprotei archaeon]
MKRFKLQGKSSAAVATVSLVVAVVVIAVAVYMLWPAKPAECRFELQASLDKPYYRVGDEVSLSIVIRNLNDTATTQTVEVKVDNEVVYSEDVEIPASGSKTVAVGFKAEKPSTITVTVGEDSTTLSLEVVRCVTDFWGRDIEIPYNVERVVVLAEYEIVYALGAWDKVVGVSKYAYTNPVMCALKDINISEVPSPGSSWSLNVEELLALDPQVVLIYGFSGRTAETVEQLENLGIKCVVLELNSLDDIYRLIRLYGQIFGKEDRAEELIQIMNQTLDMIRERTANIPYDERPKVIHTWSKKLKVTGNMGVINDLIELAGGVNPASELEGKYVTVSIEQIIEWDPDVIIIWGIAKYGVEDIMNDTQWQTISAVVNGRVYKYPRGICTWSPEVVVLALKFAKWIHPELFSDVNVQEVADQLFMEVYGIPSPFEWEP